MMAEGGGQEPRQGQSWCCLPPCPLPLGSTSRAPKKGCRDGSGRDGRSQGEVGHDAVCPLSLFRSSGVRLSKKTMVLIKFKLFELVYRKKRKKLFNLIDTFHSIYLEAIPMATDSKYNRRNVSDVTTWQ